MEITRTTYGTVIDTNVFFNHEGQEYRFHYYDDGKYSENTIYLGDEEICEEALFGDEYDSKIDELIDAALGATR